MVDGDHEIAGRVRLATPIEIARRLVTPLLDRLFARHPNLEIELIPSTRPMDLARWEADLALRTFRPTTDPEIVFVKLREDPWGIYAKRDSMLAALSEADAIARAPWITWTEDLAQLPEAKWLTRNASTARVVVRSNDLGVMEAAATRGLGLCLLPRPFASRVQELVELALPGDWDRPISPLFLAAHGSVRNTPKVAAVWRFLEDQLRPGADPMLARTVGTPVTE